MAALRAFALIDRETIQDERHASVTTHCIRLHRLVRQVAVARREGKAREDMRRALVEVLAAVYPQDVYDNPTSWPRARRLDALALALVGDTAPERGTEKAADLLDRLASYRHRALGAYAQARRLNERALAIRETPLGADHPDTASSLNNLALLLQDQGDLVGARPLHQRALAIRETALGPDHPATAMSLNNLAMLFKNQGDLTAARPLYERALAIHATALGADHPDTATSLNNLAVLLEAQGDYVGSRPLCERALARDGARSRPS